MTRVASGGGAKQKVVGGGGGGGGRLKIKLDIFIRHRIAVYRGFGGWSVDRKWNVPIQPATYVVSYFKQTSQCLLELSKMLLPLFVYAWNVLATATGSIVSATVLWQWRSMQLFNRSCFIAFLRYVFRRPREEKLLSDVAEVTGIVKYNLTNLCTSLVRVFVIELRLKASHRFRRLITSPVYVRECGLV